MSFSPDANPDFEFLPFPLLPSKYPYGFERGDEVIVHLKSQALDGRAKIVQVQQELEPNVSPSSSSNSASAEVEPRVEVDFRRYDDVLGKKKLCNPRVGKIRTLRRRRELRGCGGEKFPCGQEKCGDDVVEQDEREALSPQGEGPVSNAPAATSDGDAPPRAPSPRLPVFVTHSTEDFRLASLCMLEPERDTVLEIGCSFGYASSAVLRKKPKNLICCDVSQIQLAECRERLEKVAVEMREKEEGRENHGSESASKQEQEQGGSSSCKEKRDGREDASASGKAGSAKQQHRVVYFDVFSPNAFSELFEGEVADASAGRVDLGGTSTTTSCTPPLQRSDVSLLMIDIGGDRGADQVLHALEICFRELPNLECAVIKSQGFNARCGFLQDSTLTSSLCARAQLIQERNLKKVKERVGARKGGSVERLRKERRRLRVEARERAGGGGDQCVEDGGDSSPPETKTEELGGICTAAVVANVGGA